MERLTVHIGDTVGMAWEHEEKHTMDEWVDMLQTLLCEYEDTGLTPEEIKILYSAECKKVTQALVEVLPQLVAAISDNLPQLVEQAVNNMVGEIKEGQA